MAALRRLDAELVRRGLARSREQAAHYVVEGRVRVGGRVGLKPASRVAESDPIELKVEAAATYVSRGAHKLLGGLAAFEPSGLVVAGRRALDAGAGTGGFTEVLLAHGAVHVVAVDVGYGQLAWSLRQDHRVTVLERTNVRTLRPEDVAPPPNLAVADLSFISLRLVLPALRAALDPDADLVLMVKPQFEVGRAAVGTGGVVRDPATRAAAVSRVAASAADLGLGVAGVVASPLPGPSGNVEYFLWLNHGGRPLRRQDLAAAIEKGPR